MRHLWYDQDNYPNQYNINTKLDHVKEYSFPFDLTEKLTKKKTWSETSSGGKATSEKTNIKSWNQIQKSRTVSIVVRRLSNKVNNLSNVISEFTMSITSTRIC